MTRVYTIEYERKRRCCVAPCSPLVFRTTEDADQKQDHGKCKANNAFMITSPISPLEVE